MACILLAIGLPVAVHADATLAPAWIEDDRFANMTAPIREVGEPSDWPLWRYARGRGATTPHQLADGLHLNWQRDLGTPRRAWPEQRDDYEKLAFDVSFEPVAAGNRIYVPSMTSDRLR